MVHVAVIIRYGPNTFQYVSDTVKSLSKDERVKCYPYNVAAGNDYEAAIAARATHVLIVDAGDRLVGKLPINLPDHVYYKESRGKYSTHRILFYRRRLDIVTSFDGLFRLKLRPNRRVTLSDTPHFTFDPNALHDQIKLEISRIPNIEPKIKLTRSTATNQDRMLYKHQMTSYDRLHAAFNFLTDPSFDVEPIRQLLYTLSATTRSSRYKALQQYILGKLSKSSYDSLINYMEAYRLDKSRPEFPYEIARCLSGVDASSSEQYVREYADIIKDYDERDHQHVFFDTSLRALTEPLRKPSPNMAEKLAIANHRVLSVREVGEAFTVSSDVIPTLHRYYNDYLVFLDDRYILLRYNFTVNNEYMYSTSVTNIPRIDALCTNTNELWIRTATKTMTSTSGAQVNLPSATAILSGQFAFDSVDYTYRRFLSHQKTWDIPITISRGNIPAHVTIFDFHPFGASTIILFGYDVGDDGKQTIYVLYAVHNTISYISQPMQLDIDYRYEIYSALPLTYRRIALLVGGPDGMARFYIADVGM